MARSPVLMMLMVLVMLALARVAPALDDAGIADAVAKLGDPDAAVRERAMAGLLSAGKVAEPALQQAARSDDPEIARRARNILDRFQLGLYPDTPREVLDLLEQYHNGDAADRQTAIMGLANFGNRGLRVLLGLRRFEHDEVSRQAILRVVGATPPVRAGAALILAEGETATAAAILKSAAEEGQSTAVRDWAALLLLRGGLDEQIAALRTDTKTSPDGGPATRLCYLARARSDLTLATQAADESDDPELVDSILVEAGDWKRLAVRYRERIGSISDTIGFTAAFCRLAGDTQGFESATAALGTFADHHDEEYLNCAQCLMLNDRVDAGVAVLMSHKDYLGAMDFLIPRLRFSEALALPVKFKHELNPAQRLQLRARAISACHDAGDRNGAAQALRAVAADNKTEKDFTTWLLLADAAWQLKETTQADDFLAAAMELPGGEAQAVLARAALPDSFDAIFWWKYFRLQHLSEPYATTLKRLRALSRGEIPPEQVDALMDEAVHVAVELRPFERDCALESIGQTLELLNRRESAERVYRRLAEVSPSFVSFQRIANCEAASGDFARAARTYEQAWDMDRTRAIPLALRGWMLLKSGDTKKGREAIDLAHVLPLGDDGQRTALEETFREHGLSDDARRERELILKTGELHPNLMSSPSNPSHTFLSWAVCNAYRLRGDEEYARGDYLAAANSWERAHLGNLQGKSSFVDPWENVVIRAKIHKTRALGLLKQSPEAAMREATIAINDSPGDAGVLVELVRAFDRAGRGSDADALFAPTIVAYAKLCEDFPGSELAHNQLAWTEARCRRRLDDALKHGLRAVELDPNDTASIDTLAEVYFERGEIDQAIAQMNRCMELEPTVARHRQQKERFTVARSGEKK